MSTQGDQCPKINDLLSEVLQDLRLARASYCRSEFTAPWGVELPYEEGVRFHFVVEGACCLLTSMYEPLWLQTGDVVLLPHGVSHVLADRAGTRPQPLADVQPQATGSSTYRLATGGGGVRTLMARGGEGSADRHGSGSNPPAA